MKWVLPPRAAQGALTRADRERGLRHLDKAYISVVRAVRLELGDLYGLEAADVDDLGAA